MKKLAQRILMTQYGVMVTLRAVRDTSKGFLKDSHQKVLKEKGGLLYITSNERTYLGLTPDVQYLTLCHQQ